MTDTDYPLAFDAAANPPASPAVPAWRRAGAQVRGAAATLVRIVRLWRARDRERAELMLLDHRDFADLGVSRGLVAAELRRWPWQKPSPEWRGHASRRD